MIRGLAIAIVLFVGCGDNLPPEASGVCLGPALAPGPSYACEPEVSAVTPELGFYTTGAALGDLDGDGRLDAVLNHVQNAHEISIVWGVSEERFVDKRTNAQTVSGVVAVGDLTNDGIDDILMAATGDRAYVLAGTTDRSLSALPVFEWSPTDGVTLVDANGDGTLDLVGALSNPYRSGVLQTALNDGTGNFARPSIVVSAHYVGLYGRVATGDLDCDGNLDIVAPAVSLGPNVNGVEVLLGDGSGHFVTHRWYEGAGDGVLLADVDADGLLDLFTQDDLITVGLRRGVGDGTFGERELFGVPYIGAMTVGDVTGDAKPDLVVATRVEVGASQPGGHVHVFENVDGTFTGSQQYGDQRFWSHVAIGDIDADGHDDIVAVDEAGFVSALRQACVAAP